MKNSKLFDIFKALDRVELRNLRDFVQSPYFNKQEELVLFCEELISLSRRNWPANQSQAEQIYSRLFPGKRFAPKHWSYLSSDLLRLCEQFIANEFLHRQATDYELLQLKALNDRGLGKFANRQERRILKGFQTTEDLSIDRLYQQHLFYHLTDFRLKDPDSRSASPQLQEQMDTLDSFYISRKLQLACDMLSWQAILNQQYQIRWHNNPGVSQLENLPSQQLPQLFSLAFQLLQSTNQPELLLAYTKAMRSAAPKLQEIHLVQLYQHAINYCARQIRSGHRPFLQHLFSLYQDGLEGGYLLEKGVLSAGNFKNIIKLGLGLGQLDWVEQVVEKYTDLLPPGTHNDAYHYNLADLNYYRKNYDTALDHLQSTEFTDIHYSLGARAMLIKIYYEQEASEALESLFSSFYIYLLRNKLVAKGTKDAYLNFIRFTKQLDRAKSAETLEKIRTRIDKVNSLNDRTWLLNQCAKSRFSTSG